MTILTCWPRTTVPALSTRGHLTDVYLTNIEWSYGILIFTACAFLVYSGIDLVVSSIWKLTIFHHSQTVVVLVIIVISYNVGLGLFQANAIQFGLDQLLEAPTSKLVAFIHWYYWAQNVGNLALFYVLSSGFVMSEEIDDKMASNNHKTNLAKHLISQATVY